MKEFIYAVDIRNKNGKLYKDRWKNNVTDHAFRIKGVELPETSVTNVMEGIYEEYKAVCKRGSKINVICRVFNDISQTYMELYEYNENGFKKL